MTTPMNEGDFNGQPSMLGRAESFAHGVSGGPEGPATVMESPGLQQDSAQQTAEGQQMATTPHSVLQSLLPSGNGSSEQDAQRMLYGSTPGNKIQMPSPNGVSARNYQQTSMLRMRGDSSEVT